MHGEFTAVGGKKADYCSVAGESEKFVAAGGEIMTAVQAMDDHTVAGESEELAAAGGGMVTAVQAVDDHTVAGEIMSEQLVAVEEEMVTAVQAMDDHTVAGESEELVATGGQAQQGRHSKQALREELVIGVEKTLSQIQRPRHPVQVEASQMPTIFVYTAYHRAACTICDYLQLQHWTWISANQPARHCTSLPHMHITHDTSLLHPIS